MSRVQVRNCSAWHYPYYQGCEGLIDAATGELYEYDRTYCMDALVSYSSMVAFYDRAIDTLYLLPRYDYSVTTWQHLRKWADDVIGMPVYKEDVERGEKCGTAIVKCSGWLFLGKVYKY